MGTITLTVEGTTVGTVAQGGGIVISKTVSEVDSARLLQAYAAIYSGIWKDAEDNPRAPTYAEIIAAWFGGIIAGSVASVKSHEQTVAREQAANGVSDISVT